MLGVVDNAQLQNHLIFTVRESANVANGHERRNPDYSLTKGKMSSKANGWIAFNINKTRTGRQGTGVGSELGRHGVLEVGVRVPVGESAGEERDEGGGDADLELEPELGLRRSTSYLRSTSPPQTVLTELELDGDRL